MANSISLLVSFLFNISLDFFQPRKKVRIGTGPSTEENLAAILIISKFFLVHIFDLQIK